MSKNNAARPSATVAKLTQPVNGMANHDNGRDLAYQQLATTLQNTINSSAESQSPANYQTLSGVSTPEVLRLHRQAERYHRSAIMQLRKKVGLTERTAALLGCGPGAEIPIFADAYFNDIIGIDTNEIALAIAEKQAISLGLNFTKIICNLENSIDLLPSGIVSVVFMGFLETHIGRDLSMRAAARLLQKQGSVAISDIDYAGMRASYCVELFDLLVAVNRIVAPHSSDQFQAGVTAGRLGFTLVHSERHIKSLHGREVLSPFEFVLTMNDEENRAQNLQALYQLAARSARLSEAKLELEHYVEIWQKRA